MEQYYINSELFDILQECGFIKTKKDFIKEEKEKNKLKGENRKNQEDIDLDGGYECPFEAIKEDILSGMSLSNEYLYDAYYAVYNNIKDTDTPLYFSGISLGGMVAQQLSGLSYIKNYYTVSNVVSLASPILAQDDINYDVTTVRRMVDTNDIVPTLSTKENGSYE